jgi:preprotein translocase subunit YajC
VPPAQQQGTHTTATEQAAPPPTDGGAAPPPSGGFSSMVMLLMFVPLILFLFWQSAVNALKKGDRVVTQSGLIGKLLDVDTRYAKVELAPGVKVQVLRTSLVGRDGEDSAKTTSDKTESEKKTEK